MKMAAGASRKHRNISGAGVSHLAMSMAMAKISEKLCYQPAERKK